MDKDRDLQTRDFTIYHSEEDISINAVIRCDALWLSQKSMAELYGVQVPAVSKHLKNIFEEGELGPNVVISKMEITTIKGFVIDNVLQGDALVAKKYLNEQEIRSLERSVSGFFDYIEGQIERGNTFTMEDFAESLDKFLTSKIMRFYMAMEALRKRVRVQKQNLNTLSLIKLKRSILILNKL